MMLATAATIPRGAGEKQERSKTYGTQKNSPPPAAYQRRGGMGNRVVLFVRRGAGHLVGARGADLVGRMAGAILQGKPLQREEQIRWSRKI